MKKYYISQDTTTGELSDLVNSQLDLSGLPDPGTGLRRLPVPADVGALLQDMDEETEELNIPTTAAIDATEVVVTKRPIPAAKVTTRFHEHVDQWLDDPINKLLAAHLAPAGVTPRAFIRSLRK